MALTAKTLIDAAKRKQEQVDRKNPAHPDEIAQSQAAANLALAQSNVELADAIKALTEAAGKNSATIKDAIVNLSAKLAELAKR
ncbi:hypothetical protein HYE82_04695 [Streptomyces sp. BR123]|uniref:hypothetical protein n=1 Tax=Streptomyces sp. BR123 TaxID=2749828 RepID=UPI0015C4A247|nr:hypothetical protein [Streptomyces sp. BR123]NXY93709.1 hypothetical protein [Streptomyces sp. BR123]